MVEAKRCTKGPADNHESRMMAFNVKEVGLHRAWSWAVDQVVFALHLEVVSHSIEGVRGREDSGFDPHIFLCFFA